MKIKFGPHAEKEVSELPIPYVKQLLQRVRIRNPKLLEELRKHVIDSGQILGDSDRNPDTDSADTNQSDSINFGVRVLDEK